jgi:hypothetical protein
MRQRAEVMSIQLVPATARRCRHWQHFGGGRKRFGIGKKSDRRRADELFQRYKSAWLSQTASCPTTRRRRLNSCRIRNAP